MRGKIVLLAMCLGAADAQAVDYRWTQGFAQGTVEAIIENARGSNLNIYCPSGQEDHTPGMFVTGTGLNPPVGERVTAQVIVDGKNYAFDLDEQQFKAGSRLGLQDFQALVSALAASRARSFTIEFPKYGLVETFSLAGAAKALGKGKTSILKGCVP
ncbi:hypothetical protein SSBR45G_27440 [Bradyrhizobium sp. SSBR45G]|uniref:hypothetical protein n=1 Tax=unclassified Bradyrhizobium TaxID=2631580 RepID=UPI002342A688|nr:MULTISPECIES: hypothetical protein [unclassified Bradyrhizobium]GLH77836.1 hypothetical protein SSBR45G_27440 [Bradyrhizobium sp. SSBR45G]GLH85542.1 hypothetical protein SSBR45R_30020 [Bradyrhizobium sp. SSBR45R]